MLQILGVREEGSGRIEAERESREKMGGVIKRVITGGDTVILWLSICYGCNGQECTGGEARNLGMCGPQPQSMLPRGCCLSKKGACFFSVMDAGCRKNNRQVSKQMLHWCFTSLSSLWKLYVTHRTTWLFHSLGYLFFLFHINLIWTFVILSHTLRCIETRPCGSTHHNSHCIRVQQVGRVSHDSHVKRPIFQF